MNVVCSPARLGKTLGISLAALIAAGSVQAADLTLMLNQNDNQAAALTDLLVRYKQVAPHVNVTLNVVGFDIIRDQLKGQLEAGVGPDIALVANLGGLNPHYVDLTPYVDVAEWERNYGSVLPWYRAGKPDGIFGFHSELTVTGPFVNRTLFEEAKVELPPAGATWDDWAAATRAVKEATGSYAGMVMDRSGHRFAGPAMSYGAAYFDADGHFVIDDGYKAFAERMIAWHEEGLMPPDIWPAVSGAAYANGNDMFAAGEVPFHMAGSWNVGNVMRNVGDKFDWAVAPVPCGPAGCGVMPGGQGFVAFNHSANKEEAAKLVAWLGSTEIAREWYGKTFAIPAHLGIQTEGIDYVAYGADQRVSESLNTFAAGAARAATDTPQAFDLQGSKFAFVMFNATVQYLSAVMTGSLGLDTALERIREELNTNARDG
jgi:alpha-1,4-digalacturonate transport system substrate-binding protein